MKVWRKFTAVALVFVMALAMSATALAEPVALTNGVAKVNVTEQAPLGTALSDTSVVISKTIRVYNAGTAATVYKPDATFTYTVTPATLGETAPTITDSVETVLDVKAGIIPGVHVSGGTEATANAQSATGQIVLSKSAQWNASANGTDNTETFSIDFGHVVWADTGENKYGVYRYKITESLGTYANYSMADGTDNSLFLDVYVNGDGGIYGFVCFTSDDSDGGNIVASAANKVQGFTAPTFVDSYYTYDLTVSKTVQNDPYGQTLTFPFYIAFTSVTGMTAANFQFTETAATGSTGISSGNPLAGNAYGTAQVKPGASIVYSGIPCGINATVYETNDKTGITYSATTSLNGTAGSAETLTYNEPTTAVSTATTAAQTDATAQTISIVNKLVLISPTGVTLRYAPYLLMLGAGVVALPLSIRRKREDF